jgi:hypothetical protein
MTCFRPGCAAAVARRFVSPWDIPDDLRLIAGVDAQQHLHTNSHSFGSMIFTLSRQYDTTTQTITQPSIDMFLIVATCSIFIVPLIRRTSAPPMIAYALTNRHSHDLSQ